MKIYKAFSVILIAVSLLAINGCSKSSSNPESSQSTIDNTPPALPQAGFSVPGSTSKDPVMGLISGYIGSINALKAYSDTFAGIKAVRQNDDWVWTYTRGDLTITLTAAKQSDGNIQWNVFLSGIKDSVRYDKWLSAEGITTPDGKNGTWTFYKESTKIIEGKYNWEISSDGTLTGTATAYKNGNETGRIEVLNHSDKSGQVEVFIMNNLFFKAAWQSDGSGQWWRYGMNGALIGGGTWS